MPKEFVGRLPETHATGSSDPGSAAAPARPLNLKFDIPLLLAVISLQIIGIVMVFSASYDYSRDLYGDPYYVFKRQLMWLGISMVACIAAAILDYHWWKKIAVWMMAVTVLMLSGVFIVSELRHGAMRTLFEGSVQPSELAKLTTIIYLAVWLFSKRERLSQVGFGLFPLAGILGLLGGLIFLQPDLSAVITIFILGGLMFFLAGTDLKQIFMLFLLAGIVSVLVVWLHPTGSQRLKDFVVGVTDPTQASYHVRRAYEAFVSGGVFGVGIGKSETKLIGLPVPPTDSIYAVIGEETGMVGALLLVGLFTLLFWRGIRIASRAPDDLGALLAAGLSVWIAVEAFINMAVMVNLIPFAGNALPFISYGGSSLLVSLTAVGILINISRRSIESMESQGRLFGAVVNLRWRDGRRRVSRSYRSTSADLER